jgi:hypothetical protein
MAFTRAIARAVRRDLARIDVTRVAMAACHDAGRQHARDGFTRREQLAHPARMLAAVFLAGAGVTLRVPDQHTAGKTDKK